MNDKTLVERIRNRIHDAPMPTEHLLDEAADRIELLQTILEVTSKEKIDTIEALQSRIEALEAALRDAKAKAEHLHGEIGRFGYGRLQRSAWEHVEALAAALEGSGND